MADNYFTILRNTGMPTTWFNDGVELSGGQAFTVGKEGDARNWMHIERALELLLSSYFKTLLRSLPPPSPSRTDRLVNAPCIGGRPAVLTTNIALLPEFSPPSPSVRLREVEAHRNALLGSDTVDTYINHPLSHAVDGKDGTFFQSTKSA
jgi:hypothetical protein